MFDLSRMGMRDRICYFVNKYFDSYFGYCYFLLCILNRAKE